ncbi:MAG TPA: MauE/DoxX family redox-associated membrane protein [Streptosporangiaceae bacterium]|jgi:uncharacterized membrane protein YphA (DoxX/SURF4 family)|nr:MauE/DoxX family redox-associated membrane protein [Streptosporangiaceae bacterium]
MMNDAGLTGTAATILLIMRLCIAGAFVRAGAVKLADLNEVRLAITNYQILPAGLTGVATVSVPAVEVTAGLLLLLGVFPAEVAAVLAALLVCFSAAIAVNLARGRVFDCGCGGSAAPRMISWQHVAVNTVLAGSATVIAIVPPASLDLFRGTRGIVAVAVPGGSVLPVTLAAALVFILTRLLASATARGALRVRRS